MTTSATEPTTATLTGDYDIDPSHSRLGFAAKHAMIATVRGEFRSYRAEVHLDEADPAASHARIEIDTASVDTGNADRDTHLRSADFFDVERFPTLTFTSTAVTRTGDDRYAMTGDLTINGRTNPVTVDFELTGTSNDPWGNFRAGFEGRTTVNRRDWGLEWNVGLDKGGVLVSEKIRLEFDLSAVKRA